MSEISDRLTVHNLAHTLGANSFADDVRAGLSSKKKSLLPKYFYDDLGSQLFVAICRLPEYYLTRAESEILRNHAEEIAASIRGPVRLIELGSGSAEKTRYLIDALLARQGALHYEPIDISPASIAESSRELLKTYPRLRITAYAADYFTALEAMSEEPRATDERAMALFLGSNIGNFDRDESLAFLRAVRRALHSGDGLLVGADLKKTADILVPAYDDPLGVTAVFNLNLLVRINRELGANFDLKKFEHRAVYNESEGRMEMYLVSRARQTIAIRSLDVEIHFEEGETIHTENSYKYDTDQLAALARESNFSLDRTWTDSLRRFSFNLFAVR
ncbi:MAG: L-histidine N(alpha)-methyltransferase [Acidobacteriota bacterium]